MPGKLDELGKHRNEILWWEICALLHDVGKLSDEFLFYRQNWHLMKGGYGKDPHEGWFEVEDLLGPGKEFEGLQGFFEKPLATVTAAGITGTISVRHAADGHGKGGDGLLDLLKLADGADSAYDRNNPLPGCEQTVHEDPGRRPEVYRSNTFGYEGLENRVYRGEMSTPDGIDKPPKRASDGILTRAREELYRELLGLIRPVTVPGVMDSKLYRGIREAIRKHFAPAMADTTRPDNDTDLWEHTYSVASITKALHIQRVLGLGTPKDKAEFRIWGFGFDALRYLSFAHKIGDLLGRREILKTVFDRAEELFEYEIPLGNSIYRDDNFVFFLVPAESEGFDEELQERLRTVALQESEGELVPSFAASGAVRSLTRIVEQMQVLRKRTRTPVAGGAAGLHRAFEESWRKLGRPVSVCPVCRVRPIRKEGTEEGKVCSRCRDRRRGHTKESLTLKLGAVETPFLEEIADRNGRAALIVAKLGIRDWLEGSLVRTNLVTQTDAVARTKVALENIREEPLGTEGKDRAKWLAGRPNTHAQMLAEVVELRGRENPEALFLYGRGIVGNPAQLNTDIDWAKRDWEEVLSDAGAEHPFLKGRRDDALLLNLLCGKTPTPSTVLDVWRTAEDFFAGITKERQRFGQEPNQGVFRKVPPLIAEHEKELDMGPRPRGWVEVDKIPEGLNPAKNETFAAEIGGFGCEAVYEGNANRFWIVWPEAEKAWEKEKAAREQHLWHRPDWEEQELVLTRENEPPRSRMIRTAGTKPEAYLPYREISHSPQLLLLLVPADRALRVAQAIYGKYLQEFGKAYGRLPLYLGAIFFPRYLPMFSVLDAARRMEAGFRRLEEGPWVKMKLPVDARKLELDLGPQGDGIGREDWHHPYVLTAESLKGKPSYFETLAGPVARFQDAGDAEVLVRPNLFDWELLGASAHRFELHLTEEWGDPAPAPCWKRYPDLPWEEFRSATKRGGGMWPGPVLMEHVFREDMPGSIANLWGVLRASGISDASLRNFGQLLRRRLEEWKDVPEAERNDALLALARSLASGYFKRERCKEAVLKGVETGMFFRTVELHLGILRKRLREGVT